MLRNFDECLRHKERPKLRYFNAAGADPEAEIGEDHSPETHLIPLALDAAMGLRDDITVYGTDYDTPDGTCVQGLCSCNGSGRRPYKGASNTSPKAARARPLTSGAGAATRLRR